MASNELKITSCGVPSFEWHFMHQLGLVMVMSLCNAKLQSVWWPLDVWWNPSLSISKPCVLYWLLIQILAFGWICIQGEFNDLEEGFNHSLQTEWLGIELTGDSWYLLTAGCSSFDTYYTVQPVTIISQYGRTFWMEGGTNDFFRDRW